MRTPFALALPALLSAAAMPETQALAGELDHPGLAFPKGFSTSLREQIMEVLTAAPETYSGGGFVNAQTTLRYSGSTAALNRFLAGLAGCPGTRLQVVFTNEPEAPAWSLIHNAWADATLFLVRISPGAKEIKLEDLQIPAITAGTGAGTANPTPQEREPNREVNFGAAMERVIPFGVPCARKLFRFRTGEVFEIGDGPADTSDHAKEWAFIEAGGGVDAECFGSRKGFQLVGRGCVFTRDPAPNWETIAAGKVVGNLRRAAWITGVIEARSAELPMTWLFRTFTGHCGILEIRGIGPDADGLEVRYRLVEPTEATAAAE
jgi:hypothetical protein